MSRSLDLCPSVFPQGGAERSGRGVPGYLKWPKPGCESEMAGDWIVRGKEGVAWKEESQEPGDYRRLERGGPGGDSYRGAQRSQERGLQGGKRSQGGTTGGKEEPGGDYRGERGARGAPQPTE